MNKLALLLLILPSITSASIIFTIDTDRSGFSSVVISIDEQIETEIILPEDAKNFRIVGGEYSISNSTAFLSPGKSGFMTFSFSSDLLTQKTPSGWELLATPPDGALVRIRMPSHTTIERSSTAPLRVSSEDSRTTIEMNSTDIIKINYHLDEQQIASTGSEFPMIFVVGAFILGIIGCEAARALLKRKNIRKIGKTEKEPNLITTAGKKEMMETFNENDNLIVSFLLQHGGKSRRNELERGTNVSKSSLAMALNRLERRKIVEMDRTSTTHFVKLSDYFLRL